MGNLAGKVAIITGSARGIGRASAEKLAQEGAKVVIADLRLEVAQATAEEIKGQGLQAIALPVDVSKKEQIDQMVASTVEKYGAVDILVNNAGVLGRQSITEMEEEEWDKVYDINCKGPLFCCKAVVPYMKKSGKGKIINISSIAAIIPRQNQTHYCGSKAAVIHWSRVLALELAPVGINVNVLCPGMTDTEMISTTLDADPGARERWASSVPMGKLASPMDQANMIYFLASTESDHITGQVFIVDGGQTISFSHGFGTNVVNVTQ